MYVCMIQSQSCVIVTQSCSFSPLPLAIEARLLPKTQSWPVPPSQRQGKQYALLDCDPSHRFVPVLFFLGVQQDAVFFPHNVAYVSGGLDRDWVVGCGYRNGQTNDRKYSKEVKG